MIGRKVIKIGGVIQWADIVKYLSGLWESGKKMGVKLFNKLIPTRFRSKEYADDPYAGEELSDMGVTNVIQDRIVPDENLVEESLEDPGILDAVKKLFTRERVAEEDRPYVEGFGDESWDEESVEGLRRLWREGKKLFTRERVDTLPSSEQMAEELEGSPLPTQEGELIPTVQQEGFMDKLSKMFSLSHNPEARRYVADEVRKVFPGMPDEEVVNTVNQYMDTTTKKTRNKAAQDLINILNSNEMRAVKSMVLKNIDRANKYKNRVNTALSKLEPALDRHVELTQSELARIYERLGKLATTIDAAAVSAGEAYKLAEGVDDSNVSQIDSLIDAINVTNERLDKAFVELEKKSNKRTK